MTDGHERFLAAGAAALTGRARASRAFERLHAFPNVTNAASNALCRTAGFALAGDVAAEFRGARLRCNHWVLEI